MRALLYLHGENRSTQNRLIATSTLPLPWQSALDLATTHLACDCSNDFAWFYSLALMIVTVLCHAMSLFVGKHTHTDTQRQTDRETETVPTVGFELWIDLTERLGSQLVTIFRQAFGGWGLVG